MEIKVDRLNHSVIAVRTDVNRNTEKHLRKRWYNKKTHRGKKIVKTLINYMYHENKKKFNPKNFFFITLTTKQHESGMSDKYLYNRVGRWLRNQKVPYVCTVERQRNTGDLHFHILLLNRPEVRYCIRAEIRYFAKRFKINPHPAIFDVKRIPPSNVAQIVGYVNKYVGKQSESYSSIFQCRTFSVAKRLRNSFKRNAQYYVRTIKSAPAIRTFLNTCGPDLIEKNATNFFASYNFKPYFWNVAESLVPATEKIQLVER